MVYTALGATSGPALEILVPLVFSSFFPQLVFQFAQTLLPSQMCKHFSWTPWSPWQQPALGLMLLGLNVWLLWPWVFPGQPHCQKFSSCSPFQGWMIPANLGRSCKERFFENSREVPSDLQILTHQNNSKGQSTWNDIFQALKENAAKTALLYTWKLPFRIKAEINNLQDKNKLKEFMTTKPTWQKIWKGILHTQGVLQQHAQQVNSSTAGGEWIGKMRNY